MGEVVSMLVEDLLVVSAKHGEPKFKPFSQRLDLVLIKLLTSREVQIFDVETDIVTVAGKHIHDFTEFAFPVPNEVLSFS